MGMFATIWLDGIEYDIYKGKKAVYDYFTREICQNLKFPTIHVKCRYENGYGKRTLNVYIIEKLNDDYYEMFESDIRVNGRVYYYNIEHDTFFNSSGDDYSQSEYEEYTEIKDWFNLDDIVRKECKEIKVVAALDNYIVQESDFVFT